MIGDITRDQKSLMVPQTRNTFPGLELTKGPTAHSDVLGVLQLYGPDGTVYLDQDIDFGATGLYEVFQNVKYILLTALRSVPLDREFGMNFTMIDKPIPVAEAMLSQEIAMKIAMYEPRCQFEKIDFDQNAIAGKLSPSVTIAILTTEEVPSRVPSEGLLPGVPTTPLVVVGPDVNSFVTFLLDLASTPGPEGPKGDAATVECGDTYTGEPGTLADVENVGTPYNAIFEFTIPRGDKGDNAYTLVVQEFIVPEVGETIDIEVEDADWIVVGEMLWVEGANGNGEAGELKVVAKSGNIITLQTPAVPHVIEEAPVDGQLYGRQNERWHVVPAGGGGGGTTVEYDLDHRQGTTVGSGDYTYGVNFTVSVDGYLKEVSFYKTAGEASNVNHSFILWDSAGVPLWNHPPDNETAIEGWQTHRLSIPLPLPAGTYVLGVHYSVEYPWGSSYFPYTDGPLTANTSCNVVGNGFPATAIGGHYSIDLVFAVSGEASSGIEEAPVDGKQYARQDASWTEVEASTTRTLSRFTAIDVQGGTATEARVGTSKVLEFLNLAISDAIFADIMPEGIDLTNGVEVILSFTTRTVSGSSPPSQTPALGVAFDRVNNSSHLAGDTFFPVVNSYINNIYLNDGYVMTYSIPISQFSMDGIEPGDGYRIKIIRSSDSWTRNVMQLFLVEVRNSAVLIEPPPLPPAPVLTSLVPNMGYGSPMTVQANGSNFTDKCKGVNDSYGSYYDIPTTFGSPTQLTLQVTNNPMSVYYLFIEDEYGQRSQTLEIAGGPGLTL
jgi:uncharacterized protein